MTRAKNELSRNADFMKLYDHLDSMFSHTRSTSTSGVSAIQKGLFFSFKFLYCFFFIKVNFKIKLH